MALLFSNISHHKPSKKGNFLHLKSSSVVQSVVDIMHAGLAMFNWGQCNV